MDCKKDLKKKLSESYDRLVKQWMASTPSQLVGAAEEIAAAKVICSSVERVLAEGDAEFLLGYDDPLAVLTAAWLDESSVAQVQEKWLIDRIDELSMAEMKPGEGPTVLEFITRHPGASFHMMTPSGFISVTQEETSTLLAGASLLANPGCSGCDMRVYADEILPMNILTTRLQRGVWYMMTDYPQMEQGGPTQEVTMC